MRYNLSFLKSIMLNGLFMVLKGNAVWFYFLQMNRLPPNVFMCILPQCQPFSNVHSNWRELYLYGIREYRLRS